MRVLSLVAAFAIVGYLGLLAIFFTTQRKLLYYPSQTPTTLIEARANPAFSEISVKTHDGIELKGWYAPATTKPYTIVFFHGNADSLRYACQIADPYIANGYGFFLAEYRGYSGLPGKPSESGLYNDGRAYLQELLSRGIDSRHIVLFGHSLGTGVAIQMATEYRAGGMMLLAPYLSIPKVAQTAFPFIPAGLLALDRFENERKISRLQLPLLVANGSSDQVIPPSQGEKLFQLANEPKEFHSLPGRGHNDAFDDFASLSLDWMKRLPDH
jgi:fermentation-respiration switch protein FrsA (DUF1100 family)